MLIKRPTDDPGLQIVVPEPTTGPSPCGGQENKEQPSAYDNSEGAEVLNDDDVNIQGKVVICSSQLSISSFSNMYL